MNGCTINPIYGFEEIYGIERYLKIQINFQFTSDKYGNYGKAPVLMPPTLLRALPHITQVKCQHSSVH